MKKYEQLQKENDELNTLLKERETQLEELQAQVSLLSANVGLLRDFIVAIELTAPSQISVDGLIFGAHKILNETQSKSLERSEKEGEASLRHIESRIAERQCEQLKAAVEEETIERCIVTIRKHYHGAGHHSDPINALKYQKRKYKEQSNEGDE